MQGADDQIYRYDGRTGALESVWGKSTFDLEAAAGAYVVGRHGGAALLGWDGSTTELSCGPGAAARVSPTGGCGSVGPDGLFVRLVGDAAARQVLPADWAAGGVPTWSPDGRRLLLVRGIEPRPGPGMDPGLAALWLLEPDGRLREVYRPPERGVLTAPSWSPDGTKALVRQYETTSASFAADGVGVSTLVIDL
ncbi:MAG: PD40 domain-containing protein, partial [Chloroflexi bacterium]|nr:PD40 domain-containing protein [Chloroflexota bacterium]